MAWNNIIIIIIRHYRKYIFTFEYCSSSFSLVVNSVYDESLGLRDITYKKRFEKGESLENNYMWILVTRHSSQQMSPSDGIRPGLYALPPSLALWPMQYWSHTQ